MMDASPLVDVSTKSRKITSVPRYRTCADTRGDKSSRFRDSNKRRRSRTRSNGKEEGSFLFRRGSIARRHYFLPGRRYKWYSTIRETVAIDILSAVGRVTPKSIASTLRRKREREREREGERVQRRSSVSRREISQGAANDRAGTLPASGKSRATRSRA